MHAGFSHWIGRNPLAVLALVAIGAIITVDAVELRASNPFLAATGALLVVTWWRPRVWLLLPAVAMIFACRHALRLEETRTHPLRQQLLAMGDQPVSVILRGHLLPYESGATLDARRALCEVRSIAWPGGGKQPLRAVVRLGLPPGFGLTKPGLYEIRADLTLPKPPMNPAQFNAVEYSLRMGWVAEGHASAVRLLVAEAWSPRFHLTLAAESCRQWICRQLSRDLEDDPETAVVIMAMALGASEAAADEVEDAFRDSGTLHVFAVSGLHVALVATVGWLVLRLFSVRRVIAVTILIGIVFGYSFVTGWRPSAARAAWMIGVFMGASLIQRQSSLQNSLGAAALILLAADSHQLFQPGFQLSFGVLWAIAIGVAPLMTVASPWCQVDPFIPQPLVHWRRRAWSSVCLGCASLVSVSLAAWVGGFPLMLGHFQTVTPIALIANCFVVPLSFFCIGATCLSLGFASLGLVGAQVLMNNTNWLLAKTMVAAATLFADAPLATFHLNPKPGAHAPPAELRVLYLPGGGAASHLRVGERQWLIDTGNAKGWRSTVRPWLRHAGVNHLNGILLTHGDAEHAGATELAAQRCRPEWLCTSLHEPWPHDPSFATLRKLQASAENKLWIWQHLGVDQRIELGPRGTATVLYPGSHDRHDKSDDRALVLMLELEDVRVLWMGDAGFITEKALLERKSRLKCDILIRSHHGSDPSGLTEFLLAARPQAMICSNDRQHVQSQLPQRVRDYCTAHGAALFDLETCGSIGIAFANGSATLTAFRNGQSTTVRPE